jgi:hypothetical protein
MSMRLLFLLVILSCVSRCVADEPSALVQARKTHDAKLQKATETISEEYLKKLAELKQGFMAKGDLESALAVQKEIDKINFPNSIVGVWQWPSSKVEFKKDGTCKIANASGKWKCLDKKTKKYQIVWSTGFIDTVTLALDGKSLAGKNNRGDSFTVQRIVD